MVIGFEGCARACVGWLAGLAACVAPVQAGALPLFAGETGESCAACHTGSRVTDKIGGFVPGLSVNSGASVGPFSRAPAYVPLSVLMNSGSGNFGSSLGFVGRGGADARNLTVDGFWRPTQRLRLGAQYTLVNKPEAPLDAYDAIRRDAGTLFLYLRHAY